MPKSSITTTSGPSAADYLQAVKTGSFFAAFDYCKNAMPVRNESDEIINFGKRNVVIKMEDANKKAYAVKCFCGNDLESKTKYPVIAEAIRSLSPAPFIAFDWLTEGIDVDDVIYPILIMPWVDGDTLADHIKKHISNRNELRRVAHQFFSLTIALHRAGLSHGELKPSNIIVTENGLKLIDYDTIFTPRLANVSASRSQREWPTSGYIPFSSRADAYCAWLIYASLRALELDANLSKFFHPDYLLFTPTDLAEPSKNSAVFEYLRTSQVIALQEIAKSVSRLQKMNFDRIPLLHEGGLDQKQLWVLDGDPLSKATLREGKYVNESEKFTAKTLEEGLPASWVIVPNKEVVVAYNRGNKRDAREEYQNIDFLVIGVYGVYVLEAKNWSGTISGGPNGWIRESDSHRFPSALAHINQAARVIASRAKEAFPELSDRKTELVRAAVVFTHKGVVLELSEPNKTETLLTINNLVTSLIALDEQLADRGCQPLPRELSAVLLQPQGLLPVPKNIEHVKIRSEIFSFLGVRKFSGIGEAGEELFLKAYPVPQTRDIQRRVLEKSLVMRESEILNLLAGKQRPEYNALLDWSWDCSYKIMTVKPHTATSLAANRKMAIPDQLLIAKVTTGSAKALEALHQKGILHRSITPESISIGDLGAIVYSDFALARIFTPLREKEYAQIDALTDLINPSRYCRAPECIESLASADVASDYYSLAASLYEWITGRVARSIESVHYDSIEVLRPDLGVDFAKHLDEQLGAMLSPNVAIRGVAFKKLMADYMQPRPQSSLTGWQADIENALNYLPLNEAEPWKLFMKVLTELEDIEIGERDKKGEFGTILEGKRKVYAGLSRCFRGMEKDALNAYKALRLLPRNERNGACSISTTDEYKTLAEGDEKLWLDLREALIQICRVHEAINTSRQAKPIARNILTTAAKIVDTVLKAAPDSYLAYAIRAEISLYEGLLSCADTAGKLPQDAIERAISDITKAIEAIPPRTHECREWESSGDFPKPKCTVDFLCYRASLKIELGQFESAWADLVRAIYIDSSQVDETLSDVLLVSHQQRSNQRNVKMGGLWGLIDERMETALIVAARAKARYQLSKVDKALKDIKLVDIAAYEFYEIRKEVLAEQAPEISELYGKILCQKKLYAEAIQKFEWAIALRLYDVHHLWTENGPIAPNDLLTLGVGLTEATQKRLEMEKLENGKSLAFKEIYALMEQVKLHKDAVSQEQFDAAWTECNKLVAERPDSISARLLLARVMRETSARYYADDECLEAIRLEPRCLEAYLLLCEYSLDDSYSYPDKSDAIKYATWALMIEPNCQRAFELRGDTRIILEDMEGARQDYRSALATGKNETIASKLKLSESPLDWSNTRPKDYFREQFGEPFHV